MSKVRRIFVEKKVGYDVEGKALCKELKESLKIDGLSNVRILNRYDIEGISDEEYELSKITIFSEPPVDNVYDEELPELGDCRIAAIEYLPGQYDQRADSAAQCVQILTTKDRPVIKTAKIIALIGQISNEDFINASNYMINPLECRKASMTKPETLVDKVIAPEEVKEVSNFIYMKKEDLAKLHSEVGFAMSVEDLEFCQNYFLGKKRNPRVTELKMIDTYWSDHCRHTTFLTVIENVEFEDSKLVQPIKEAYEEYKSMRQSVYKGRDKDMCLMDIATIAMKELKKQGKLTDLDESEEINACSINVTAKVNGKDEEWLVMFKNETHNHPTEIEPFGGAATCLGGAIRDPLSGRAYVYQAMRVTGSGDPRTKFEDTIQGKLPQKKITTGAASGYSSYGNQIGLATGQVAEIYHEGYVAKRMEIGAVIGAAPKENVVRSVPKDGDIVVLLGGRTGRDGCGGATGSSKEHTEESLLTCGAEVQKGNAPTERKIQRLFRNPEASKLIKRCNDFGAGGVSVAIGELADGLVIDLDKVPKKYEGLDGTELAISESQERMAVVLDKNDVEKFIRLANDENLEAVEVAVVTAEPVLKMLWNGKVIVEIEREFLNTNGVKQVTDIKVTEPCVNDYFEKSNTDNGSIGRALGEALSSLTSCSQKGLVERFDSSIGANTVLMPFGGKYQLTPAEGMVAKLPVLDGETDTCTMMSYGFDPYLSTLSPFHGALYAILESVAKIAALGGDISKVRLTLQEYFEKLGKDSEKWGKPFSALLGALYAQKALEVPAIGGKDSMSGTFKDMSVPPTLVSFAVTTGSAQNAISAEFKNAGNKIIYIPIKRDENNLPNFIEFKKVCNSLYKMACDKKLMAASTIKKEGILPAIAKMSFGNAIGVKIKTNLPLFTPDFGAFVIEVDESIEKYLDGVSYVILGETIAEKCLIVNNEEISLNSLVQSWQEPLERVFPTLDKSSFDKEDTFGETKLNKKVIDLNTAAFIKGSIHNASVKIAKPRVVIPVFPGTNCEYDTKRAFEKAGAIADILVINNLSSSSIANSIKELASLINNAQIVMLPGGFSGGDEPDGSGKFIATAFRNPYVKEAVHNLLKNRDGLMLGICNGFQALIKLGLVPYGEIRELTSESPTLTYNTIGRHVSCMVNTRICSKISPWLNNVKLGEVHSIPVSHGEGRFVASEALINKLAENGQIATQYVDLNGNATMLMPHNPNGSMFAIEGITSPDGRVFGKMGHSERLGDNVSKNVPGNKNQKIFEAGVEYFR